MGWVGFSPPGICKFSQSYSNHSNQGGRLFPPHYWFPIRIWKPKACLPRKAVFDILIYFKNSSWLDNLIYPQAIDLSYIFYELNCSRWHRKRVYWYCDKFQNSILLDGLIYPPIMPAIDLCPMSNGAFFTLSTDTQRKIEQDFCHFSWGQIDPYCAHKVKI